jgi:hypothetical protein
MEQKIVYWANLSTESSEIMKPTPLLADISKAQSENKGVNYISCPAIRNRHKNTFVTKIPYDFSIKFFDNRYEASSTNLSERKGLYSDSYAFNWNLNRIFFSSEPQMLEVSPAFLHKTSYSQFGHAPSGTFDIGQWFRDSSPTFQLWSGENSFSAKKDEAHLYFNFPNETKIILKEFSMTETLYEISNSCITYKNYKPGQTMDTMYKDFVKNGLKEKTLNEIKKNLL